MVPRLSRPLFLIDEVSATVVLPAGDKPWTQLVTPSSRHRHPFSLHQPASAKTAASVTTMKSQFKNLWLSCVCFFESWTSSIPGAFFCKKLPTARFAPYDHSCGTSRRVCELLRPDWGRAESQSADVDEMGRHQQDSQRETGCTRCAICLWAEVVELRVIDVDVSSISLPGGGHCSAEGTGRQEPRQEHPF